MSYRSADTALAERIAEVETHLAALGTRLRDARAELDGIESESAKLRDQIEREGPGGGHFGAASLRVSTISLCLLFVALLALPAQLYIGGYLHSTPGETVVPLLISGGPALLTVVIGWSYRQLGRIYAWTVLIGMGFLFALAMIFLTGLTGVFK